jgi:neutral ceramidase
MKHSVKFPLLAAALVLITIQSCHMTSSKSGTGLMAGIAEVNYTPEVGHDLVGNYRGDDYASRGVHDSLYARAFVARGENGVTAAILTVDICEINKETADYMRGYIESETGIEKGNIMVLATHTHSGPRSDLSAPEAREYMLRAADAVILAHERLTPSVIYAGRSVEERISFNRRLKCKDGTTHMTWEGVDPELVEGYWGSKDPEVITFTINQNGKDIGTIVNFGCHATTLTGSNWLYSADYPGYLVESIRKVKGRDYLPMFFNGPCGNVTQINNDIGFLDTYPEAQRIGYLLGVSAMEAMKNQQRVKGGEVRVSRQFVPLKRMTISEERLAWARKVMERVAREGMPPLQQDGIPDEMYAGNWIRMHEIQDQIDSIEVQVIRVGDLAFVGLTGEPFNEFGVEIKAQSPCPNTMVMGLANDYTSYFPTAVSFTQGPEGFTPMITGYETTPGTTIYEIGSGEKLADAAIRQLKEIF